ncbi:DNA/RNA non-specific endonuclease [Sulfurovum sp. bin170]|uniref:DNA/RNA non-specific endonuclease n=1 Tax=Sulfurovum sp. bin170 TaxID=2695268 RepID=UPI0013E0BA40|nr:DNA/RNA non-specific endonuclease [Sulfurovum sp. bin170]NEW60052.1 DNA/RNA non-specific endonuclease [Sulfurovum sp. bin170]
MKTFNLKTTIQITVFLFLLNGCGSVETTTTTTPPSIPPQESHPATEEREMIEVNDIQLEQNSTIVTEETNSTEIEVVESEDTQLEQNSTVVTQPVDRTPPTVNEIEVVVPEEEEIDYTKQFINEDNCHQILDKEFLTICYDYNLKVAKSVSYTLYGDLVNELNIKERPSFYVEREIDVEYRATTADYTNTGYDRGHLAPDASFDWSEESLDSTYSLANIIPQVPEVNRRSWVKVENYARAKAIELFELNIVNVVSYSSSPSQIGDNSISISDGYYKILFNIDEEYEECFYYANDFNASSEDDELEHHKVDCTTIQGISKMTDSF